MTNWIHGNEYKYATEENVKAALRELAQHGPQTYDIYSKILRDACLRNKLSVRFPTWTEWEGEFLFDEKLTF